MPRQVTVHVSQVLNLSLISIANTLLVPLISLLNRTIYVTQCSGCKLEIRFSYRSHCGSKCSCCFRYQNIIRNRYLRNAAKISEK
jgi:hypothetical protein